MPRGRPPYPGPLTPREWQVVRLLEEGLTNEEIAARLGISFAGARYHVAEILSKLGVSSRTEAAAWSKEYAGTRRSWASLAFLVERLHLGSPAGLASAGVVVAAVAVVAIALLLLRGGGHDDRETYLPSDVTLDTADAEAFVRSLPPLQHLASGEVRYVRWETYERHGPKAPQITAANGIPVEHFVREMWIEAGPDDAFVRGYGRVLDVDGNPILAYHTEDGVSRIIDVQSGTLFRQDDVPDEMTVVGDPNQMIDRLLGALGSGELTVVSQTDEALVLESRRDEADLEEQWREHGFTEEQMVELRKGFFQRDDMEEESSFGIPFYGDLNAVELITRMHVNAEGLEERQEIVIRDELGEYIVVGWTEVEQTVVNAIPPEVIELAQTR